MKRFIYTITIMILILPTSVQARGLGSAPPPAERGGGDEEPKDDIIRNPTCFPTSRATDDQECNSITTQAECLSLTDDRHCGWGNKKVKPFEDDDFYTCETHRCENDPDTN